MIFGHNSDEIPADRFPHFPEMQSERSLVRKGVLLMLTFKFGFRKGELLHAKVGYFNAKESTFTLPTFATKNRQERVVDLVPNGEIFRMLVKLTEGRNTQDALFTRNGKPVKDYRGQWAKLTEGMTGGSGEGGRVTIHDLRRSAITAMAEKGVTAEQAGTHLTPDVFRRNISRSKQERQTTAALIEN
jgi:integrase